METDKIIMITVFAIAIIIQLWVEYRRDKRIDAYKKGYRSAYLNYADYDEYEGKSKQETDEEAEQDCFFMY
jgi:hypothetical protein